MKLTRDIVLAYMNGRARRRGQSAVTVDQSDVEMMVKFSVYKGKEKNIGEISSALSSAGPRVLQLLDSFHNNLIKEFKLIPHTSSTIMTQFMRQEGELITHYT